MFKKIKSALISVFYKDGLEEIIGLLQENDVTIYSTGGTRDFIEKLGTEVIPVEQITAYPSILGGRVKTLHPSVFGGILGKRHDDAHLLQMREHHIPEIDLVIVDLYPFEETLRSTTDEELIIEKIDVGGPSMIRAAAKNFQDVMVVAAKSDYQGLAKLLAEQAGSTSLAQRRSFAAKAFQVVAHYDVVIAQYFQDEYPTHFLNSYPAGETMRYGENPHQQALFYGEPGALFNKLHGKELSYNNLVDVDAALQLIQEFQDITFAIIKHTNVCGAAQRDTVWESWEAALAGDPESAFGGVLVTNQAIDEKTATAISEVFFEVLIAPDFDPAALKVLQSKKNRILLASKKIPARSQQFKSILNGVLVQQTDDGNFKEWKESGGREATAAEKNDLIFSNIICKHLKSNAIALVKNKQLIGKGCGQTSRIDALRQAIEKAGQFKFNLGGSVLASDAFFPFDDCVKMAHANGITAFIQPGGSIRDKDSIQYCTVNNLALIITGQRHFKH